MKIFIAWLAGGALRGLTMDGMDEDNQDDEDDNETDGGDSFGMLWGLPDPVYLSRAG